jgi:single-strand DNA-binding protein
MASLNRVFLIGNLTRDPEVRYIASGSAVADLRMAVSRKFKTNTGESKEETCFVTVTVWGRQAETCGEYLRKGSQTFVEGRLKYDEWEKEGVKQNRLTVVAERVQFMGAPKRGEVGDAPAAPARGRGKSESAPAMDDVPPPEGGSENSEDLPF